MSKTYVPGVQKAIASLLDEVDAISKRARQTPQDKLRASAILARVASLRDSAGPANSFSEEGEFREVENRKALVRAWKVFHRGGDNEELRAEQTAGQGTISYSEGTSGGYFVPTQFAFSGLNVALKSWGHWFDENKVTRIDTSNGGTVNLPVASDVENAATAITEASDASAYTNVHGLSNVKSNTYCFRTMPQAVTQEFFEDALGGDYAVTLLERVLAERIYRGVEKSIVSGNGSDIIGIIPSLQNLGVVPVIASGSVVNDGISGNTGANSIGSDDLEALYTGVDAAYRSSAKCAWTMNDNTLQSIRKIKDTSGRPIKMVHFENGQPFLLGKPVYVSPTVPAIAPSAVGTVIFGDFSRFLVRGTPANNYVRKFAELPGFAENGMIGYSLFSRWGASLLAEDSSASPFSYLAQHS